MMLLVYCFCLVVLVVCSAFFSGAETAIFTANFYRLHHLERKGDRRAALIMKLRKAPDELIGTILIGNNFVNIAASSLATLLFIQLLGSTRGTIVATLVMTLMILLFGEIAPKTYAANYPETAALRVVEIIRWIERILSPITFLISKAGRGILWFFGVSPSLPTKIITQDEIEGIISIGKQDGVLLPEEERMLLNIFKIGKISLEQVMIPRTETIFLPVDAPEEEILATVEKTRLSRIPVFEEKKDNVVGILYVKDLIHALLNKRPIDLRKMTRRPFYIPLFAKVDQALHLFLSKGIQMAIVIDEFGGTEGIVTLKDLLEEIVGEIRDEDERGTREIIPMSDGSYLARGNADIEEINKATGLNLPEEEGNLAAYILKITGRIPKPGERIPLMEGWEAVIYTANRKRILSVLIRPTSVPQQ
ncbi:MAG: HlyC/CorC family transporter [Deltaproteobacteria bacterium]|nr:HlyC/CorC family transporter [Deltaproteobacteria bacterium]